MTDSPNFALLFPSKDVLYGRYETQDVFMETLMKFSPSPHLDSKCLSSDGLYIERIWFVQKIFAPYRAENAFAYSVIDRLGYKPVFDLYGMVAISMEKGWQGTPCPLTPETQNAINSLALETSFLVD